MDITTEEVKMLIGEMNLQIYSLGKKVVSLEKENKELLKENQELKAKYITDQAPKAAALRRIDG